MALALYRKYRPRTFAEVIGQEHVTEPLSQALRSGRLNHAYLFSGPRGCGKTSSARILARSLNCEKGPTPDPCGECDSCRALAPDGSGSIDVIEIDAASHGGVDDARDLRERAFFAPVSSRFKVYVIDEAHMVSSAGFNALLKLVEEPPEYVKFVFATTEPEKVLGTIKSRTHHYPFRLIPPGVLRPYLEQLTAAEGVVVEPAVFPLVVRAGAGSARDTLSVLDQLISGAGPDGVTYRRAVALLGVTDVALIDEMCDSLAADDGRGAYGVIDRVVEAGHDPRRFASDLLERLRDLIVLQQVPDAVDKGLLDAPHDQLERMGAQASQLGQATLSRFADIVHNGLTEMRGTTAPRLLLELITARMLLPGADDSSSALLQRLERMERRILAGGGVPAPAAGPGTSSAGGASYANGVSSAGGGSVGASVGGASHAAEPRVAPSGSQASSAVEAAPSAVAPSQGAPAQPVASPAAPAPAAHVQGAPAQGTPAQVDAVHAAPVHTAPVHAAPVQAAPVQQAPAVQDAQGGQGVGGLDAGAVRRVWADVLSLVSGKSKKAAAIVREATVQDVEGTTLVLGFKHTAHANMLNASPDVLIAALSELLGGRWQVRCEVGGQPGGGGGGTRPSPPRPTPQSGPGGPPVPADGGPRGGASVPQQAAEAWPVPARPAGDPVPVDARVGGMSMASARSGAAGAPSGGSVGADGWPAPAPVPGAAAGSGPVPGAAAGSGAGRPAEAWPTPAVPGGAAADGWPAPAVPGGVVRTPSGGALADPRGRAAQGGDQSHVAGGQGSDWPVPATPGGAAPSALASGVAASGGSAAGLNAGRPAQVVTGQPGGAQAGGPGFGAGGTQGGGPGGGPGFGPGGTQGGGPGGTQGGGPGFGPGGAQGGQWPGGGGPAGGVPAGGGPAYGGGQSNGARTAGGARPQNGARPRTAIEQAREAASRAANAPRRAAAAAAPVESVWDGAAADEPPFDPDYDRPVADPRFPGLDPGDELLDDASSVRESSEEAALRLLSEALGAEKIGETTS
ncbi:DNA polymerase III subunit gamma and tau [Dactylosporangium aurantiacum]|uniref:DNA polymerase III subunit gamma/tau n=1 Tax=Dactylosporangium aurantiacum TaxID=35754 RepID=A0A9Q9IDK0_9ACTN|nr:DNA polymerase III subunit gamma and tau [Dactylosporangium aurantiacum]MDG6107575.1 DNA polymerase III subunit gamma and tau [Dactylosporangium aurantiacum]UWZ54359.1 DNA polymerase III subunit gamma and tau [Dactylosporangium aurantiacum]